MIIITVDCIDKPTDQPKSHPPLSFLSSFFFYFFFFPSLFFSSFPNKKESKNILSRSFLTFSVFTFFLYFFLYFLFPFLACSHTQLTVKILFYLPRWDVLFFFFFSLPLLSLLFSLIRNILHSSLLTHPFSPTTINHDTCKCPILTNYENTVPCKTPRHLLQIPSPLWIACLTRKVTSTEYIP